MSKRPTGVSADRSAVQNRLSRGSTGTVSWKPAEFRTSSRAEENRALDRDVPEARPGADPADTDSPEFSRGQQLDDPQPSARERPEVGREEPDRAARPPVLARPMRERAHVEALLEGVPLPAAKKDLVRWAKRNGEPQVARRLRSLPSRRFDYIDEVGEALEPVQPRWPRPKRVPQAETDLPPGGPAYGTRPNGPAAA